MKIKKELRAQIMSAYMALLSECGIELPRRGEKVGVRKREKMRSCFNVAKMRIMRVK